MIYIIFYFSIPNRLGSKQFLQSGLKKPWNQVVIDHEIKKRFVFKFFKLSQKYD